MTKEELIKKEMFDILTELKANQKLDSELANNSISEIAKELELIALKLAINTPEEVLDEINREYYQVISAGALLSPGIAAIIEDSKDKIYLSTYKGDIGDSNKTPISKDTRFDLASITKLFTVLEALKLNQDGLFNINRVIKEVERSPYRTLNITIADLLRFKYEVLTNGRLDLDNISTQQFYRRLLRPQIGLNEHMYSDIPYIIVKTLMPNSRKFFTDYYDELGLLSVGYDTNGIITGGYDFNAVADEKARQMLNIGIQPGHAGLFGTAEDLIKVFDALNKGFLNKQSLDMLLDTGTKEQYSPIYNNRGEIIGKRPITRAMGVYIEHPEGLKVGEVIPGLSKYAFSSTGYTGGYATYDLANGFSSVFLANPITIAQTNAKILVSSVPKGNKYLQDKNEKPYEEGTQIVSKYQDGKKKINIYTKDGLYVEERTYPNITNTIKKQQLFTILKLRLTKRVALALANSDNLIDHINEEYSKGKRM